MDKHKNIGHQGAAPKAGAFTLAQGLGVPSQHSEACWAQIKAVQVTRDKLKQLKAEMMKHSEFKKYEESRKVFNEARRVLAKDPNFEAYEKARTEDINANKALRKLRYECEKCKASAEIAGKH